MPAIEMRGLSKYYGEHLGIAEVDLDVEVGEVFGFIGPNGAGKTTTIRVLLDFLRATAGTAHLLGLDSHIDSLEVRRRIGYLPGDLALYERLRAEELLRWLGRLRGGVDWSYVEELSERLTLDLLRPIGELSTGNRQKVGVVQALMNRPPLLVLDEPTSGLDPLVRREVRSLIEDARGEGRTVFLSSHVLDEVEDVCDRVAMIRNGRLLRVETMADVRSRTSRRVTVEFAEVVPPTVFASLPGVDEMTHTGSTISFRVEGTLDRVIKEASRYEVVDLISEPLTLEELFLRSYEGAETGRGRTHGR